MRQNILRCLIRGAVFSLSLGAALGGLATAAPAQVAPLAADGSAPAAGVRVDSVLVQGNQRVEASVIRVTSALEAGRSITATDIQSAIRRLMATGNFADVQVLSEGDPASGVTLTIRVQERPFISRIEFEGLERVSAKTVRDTVGLAENQPLSPNLVVKTEQMVRDLLAKEGVQLISIDTTLAPVREPEGAYRLTFNVREGNRLSVADIDFRGNEAFSDETLQESLKTRPEGFLWFRTGKFDRATFEEDLRTRLPEFYGERGYIDFAVVSDTLVVDPESGKARLVVEVRDGPQYRLGQFDIQGASRFPSDQLERIFRSQRRSVLGLPFGGSDQRAQGEVFDRAALDQATQRVRQMYNNEGYLYAQVVPKVERVPATEPGQSPTVNVTWAVSEHTPFYIDKVTIVGNTYTHESVIRERLLVYPGDVYNEERLLQSYQSLGALGFFETPLPTPDIRPDAESGTVDIVFHVKEKQTGSINFGTAIGGGGYGRAGGVSGFLGYSQPNLFGQAKQADLRAEYGYGRSSFQASYTDPNVLGTRNSASVSLFHTDDRYRGFSFTDGRYTRTGVSLRYGFPVFGMRWTRAFAGYSLSRYSYEARDADDCAGNIFCQPSAVASNLSLAVTRDTKNHPLFPTAGTRQNLSVEQVGGPLGGDGNFQKVTGEAEWWVPIGRVGGGTPGSRPIQFTFGLQARAGTVFGDASQFPLQRFFLGGTQFGTPLRGYEESTLTPLGYFDRRAPGISSAERLGDAFMVFTGETAVRFNDNLSLSLFADAGSIWNDPALIDPTRLFRSIGIGATIVTPFGPLGLDYAYGFDKDDPGWKFHFKINSGAF
jgi:outer membrane protein insertion porin family